MMKNEHIGIQGLTTQEVQQRINQGLVNTTIKTITRTKKQIFKENICTLFNLLNIIIALALIWVQAWSNLAFIIIIIINTSIGIIQELHAKKMVDELSLLIVPQVKVIRNNQEITIGHEEVVLDDIMVLESGQQICLDGIVLDGQIETNEALLTGEADPIHKSQNDQVFSGSSVISGKCYAKVLHIGNENYTSKITNEVKKAKQIQSELLNSMKKVTRFTSFMIIPLGIILFVEAFVLRHNTLSQAVISSSAGLLGMLPKGLVLLISVSLAAGVTKLAHQKILIQDLYSLETLAHVDTLCLDKTGTITDGCMNVEKVHSFSTIDDEKFLEYFGSYLHFSDDNNATYQALCQYFSLNDIHQPIHKIAFSSLRKWSAMTFENYGTIVVGAPERLMSELPESLSKTIQDGKRVIVIAYTSKTINKDLPLPPLQPIKAVILTDTVRKDIEKTLQYFKEQSVDIKVISGDHVLAVSQIAKKAGLENYDRCVDMSQYDDDEHFDNIVNQYSVFGRVTPKQKRNIIQALKRQGHTVAMTGDGVNDMLALKEADCSIAVGAGSEAVRQMSQIVLLDSQFSYLPNVVLEGRRVVNNVTRVASVFFIKTIYSILLTIICAIFNIPFPFIPIQITLIDLAIEAYPAFLTLLESNTQPIKNKFLPTVIQTTLPYALSILMCLLIILFNPSLINVQSQQITMMYLSLAFISMQAVISSCYPFNKLRIFVCTTMIIGFIIAISLFHSLLLLAPLTLHQIIFTFTVICIGVLFQFILQKFIKV